MPTANPHVLLEMSDEPDCRFVSAWLTEVAKVQTLWSQAQNDHLFAGEVQLLVADEIPDLAAAALEILGELEYHRHVAVLDLYQDESGVFSLEFGLLVRLGFLINAGPRYWMAVPEQVALEAVKKAAFYVQSTADDAGDGFDVIKPEDQLHTFSASEAEALRSRLISIRRFRADTRHDGTIQ